MNIADFNFDQWQQDCIKYDKNRVGLKLETTLSLESGMLEISFGQVDEKYIPALKHLAINCAQGAIIYMNQQFIADYASETDYEEENEKNLSILKANTEDFLKILFQEGFDAFLETVSSVVTINRIKYELNQVEFKEGNFVLKNGLRWNGQMWQNAKGESVMNCISQTVWEAILPLEKKKTA